MNRTEDLLAALAPFLRKDYSGAEHDTSNTEEVNREARARVTATMVGRVAGRKEEDERHLFELSRVLVEGLYKSFIGLHKWVSLGLVDVGRSVNDGGDEPSDDIRTRCLAALEGYVNAVAEGLDYVMKNKLITASFISVFKKLKDFQSVFYLARLFFMPTDAFVLPVIRSWFVEYSQTIAECNNEYDDILSKDKIATNKPQLKTLICKLVSYGDYSRAQTLLNTFFCSTEDDAAMTAVICSLFDNYAKLLGALDKLPPNDFYRLFYRWREECTRAVSSSLSLSHDAPFHAVLRVMLGEDDTSLDSFEGVLLTRILYMRPECTVYALPQATQDVLKTFDVEDEKDFRLAPSAILEGNRRKLLALVEGTGSRWLHGLLADALCLGGRGSLHGRDFDELVASRDASIDAYAAGIVSNLFWVHAINYSKTCSAPEETTVHRDILRWVSLDSDRTERKLLAACKSFAPGLVPALHERVGVEKVRRAAYADAMKHFILSGNVPLVSAYATALVSCDVGPSCDYRALIIATATVTRRCCNPALRNEVAHVESLADIYTSLAGLRTQEYLARLAEELKRPSAPTLVKFRLVRDVAHDLKDPRNEEVRKCLTKDIVTVIVGTLEEVCLSYQSEKIFAIMPPEDINTLRKIFTGLFLV